MDHDLVVCVDAFACVHLVMPSLFDSVHEWTLAAKTRNQVPEEVLGDITEERLLYNKAFIKHLRNQGFGYSAQGFINYMFDHWQYEPGIVFSCFNHVVMKITRIILSQSLQICPKKQFFCCCQRLWSATHFLRYQLLNILFLGFGLSVPRQSLLIGTPLSTLGSRLAYILSNMTSSLF